MTPSQFAFLRADAQRAEEQGSKTMQVSTVEMMELVSLAESAASMQRSQKPMRTAGWIRPGDLRALRGGDPNDDKNSARTCRRKTPEANMELFFCDDITEKEAESVVLVARARHRLAITRDRKNRQASEVKK